MINKKLKYLILFVTVSLITTLLAGCGETKLEQADMEDFVLGTFGSMRVFASSTKKGEAAMEKAFERINEVENKMSTSIEGSFIQQINQLAGKEAVEVDDDTLFVIKEALNYEDVTQGTFNIGLGSLIDLWGIGKEWQKVPTPEEITEVLKHIDINELEIDGNNVFLGDKNMMLDLGGIAKGYAVDEAVKTLKENGIESGFVNLGGDIYAIGAKPDDTPWIIGIQNPVIGSKTVMAKIPVVNQSVVSSGDYERYFIEDDVHYHHILDPETGYPTDNQLSSVTVISEKAIDGDVLSTAVFVMGLEKGLLFLEELENIEGVMITKDKQVFATSGIVDKLEIMDNSYQLVR